MPNIQPGTPKDDLIIELVGQLGKKLDKVQRTLDSLVETVNDLKEKIKPPAQGE